MIKDKYKKIICCGRPSNVECKFLILKLFLDIGNEKILNFLKCSSLPIFVSLEYVLLTDFIPVSLMTFCKITLLLCLGMINRVVRYETDDAAEFLICNKFYDQHGILISQNGKLTTFSFFDYCNIFEMFTH